MPILTDFLKLFKWNTDSETDLDEDFDIDTAMNENWDRLDTKIKEHDDNISANTETIEKLKDTIQKQQDSMINLSTEEDTSLYIDDASVVPAKLKIMGNHRQATREGYNLAKISNYDTTFSGITLKSNIDEGYISATGTSTGLSIPIVTVTLPAGSYVFSGGPANGSSSTQRLSIYKNINGQYSLLSSIWGDNTYIVNVDEETTCRFNYVIPSGITVNNEKVYPMIVSGTETKPFQVYGVMPSIEYPSEIETVKNEVNVVVTNKNLYKITISDNNYNGIKLTVNKEKGYLSATGTSTGYSHTIGTVILKPGDYVFSGGPQNGDWNKQRLSIYVKNSEGTFENVTTIYKDTTYSVHLDEETEYRLNYVIPSSITVTDEKIYPQVEKGTVATDFIKHEEVKKTLDIQQEMLKGDHFDLKNNKEVHNWEKIESYNNETITTEYISTTGELSTGATVYYKTTPTQLDLTETQKQQLNQLNNLDLFKGINNIYTEEGIALMQLDYSADTKQTVDSLNDRITALEQQLNSTGSEG